jgi:branched-chain amino acid transport system permease protein
MRRVVFWAAAVLVLVGLQAQLAGWIGAYYYKIVILAGINIILAVSLNLINGITGQFSIGHAGFYAIGAYTSASLVTYGEAWIRGMVSFLPRLGQDAVLLLAGILVAAIAAGIAGVAVGIPSLRLRGDYLAIVTLGFGEIIRVLILNIDAIGGARGFSSIPVLSDFFLFWVFLFVLITVSTIRNLATSSYGRAFISIRDDEIAAEAMGVDTTRFKVLSFVISSMFAGIGGSLFAHYTGYLNPNSFTFIASFYLIIMIVVGGLGSIEGSILGAILITVILEAFRSLSEFRLVGFSILLVLVMLYRPQGLMGLWELFWLKRRAAVAKS